MSPAAFVPAAEQSGLSPQLDRRVFRHAVRALATLREHGTVPPEVYVSVNLSRLNLHDTELVGEFLEHARSAGVEPGSVMVEVTESALAVDGGSDSCVVRSLREAGFLVGLDDFGTGYSSLAQLRQLPVTHLKIDASFVQDIDADADAHAVAAGIAELGHALDLTLVAEGVETEQQAAVLRLLRCQVGQGWLWSPALPLADVLARDWSRPWDVPDGHTRAPSAPSREEPLLERHGLSRLLELHGRGASAATIASALNAAGYRNPSGQRWHGRTVAKVLSARAYAVPEAGSRRAAGGQRAAGGGASVVP